MNMIPMPKKISLSQVPCDANAAVNYVLEPTVKKQGYRLLIEKEKITLFYADEQGRYYGERTLKYLCEHDGVKCGEIVDYPSFTYRGAHLDVARYFMSIDEIKHFLKLMSYLKMNVLHLHLNDEQGWRIESERYPRLTEIGSKRPFSNYGRMNINEKHEGYYTKQELRDLVDYAASLHIDILPGINSPGHCSAILAAYPELSCTSEPVEVKTRGGVYKEILCAGNEKVYAFIEQILDEVMEIFPYHFIHIGADEAQKDHWRECPKCQAKMKEEGLATVAELQDYYISRIADYVKSKGRKAIIYGDGLRNKHRCRDVNVQYWVGDKEQTKKLLKDGNQVIVSTHGKYYFDLGYGQTSLKGAYEYQPCEDFKPYEEQVLGVEGMLWGEFTPDYATRIYQGFPRMLALAETAWNNDKKIPYEEFVENCKQFIRENEIKAAPERLWNMSKWKKIADVFQYYHKTMTKQDRKQFIATLKNERREKEENEKLIRD